MVLTMLDCQPEKSQGQLGKQWFALRTRPRHEMVVRDRLSKKGYVEFLPTRIVKSQWSDRLKERRTPLFPGYCFTKCEKHELSHALQLPGVCYVVGGAGGPGSISDQEIESLKQLVASGTRYALYPNISEGRSVQIVRGPLAGIRGRLVRQDAEHYVVLKVDLIKLGVSVRVQASDVIFIIEENFTGDNAWGAKPDHVEGVLSVNK